MRHDRGAEHAGADADRDPAAAAGNAARRRHHDADDQAGFDDFAKDDDECAEHDLFRDHHALGGGFVKFADERIAAGLERADAHHALRFAGDHFLDLQRRCFRIPPASRRR